MNIRSFHAVMDTDTFTLYVLVEGRVGNCTVYMESGIPFDCYSIQNHVIAVAQSGAKVSKRDADALPFRIPSHLVYRA